MDIKKPQLVKVGAFAYFFEGVLQHPLYCVVGGIKALLSLFYLLYNCLECGGIVES